MAGTEWGLPAIAPLVLPDIGIATDTHFDLDGIAVELRPVNIHAQDSLVIYLPADHILLAGDTLEDTLALIAEPEQIPCQYRHLARLKHWGVQRIYPNHGDPAVIATGDHQSGLTQARPCIRQSHESQRSWPVPALRHVRSD